jgi:CheY-like chemotaxis protein
MCAVARADQFRTTGVAPIAPRKFPSKTPEAQRDRLAKALIRFHFLSVTGDPTLLPILITDDESEDRFFLQKALRKAGIKNPILEFTDGADLLEFLGREAGANKSLSEIAKLLFLDIKMPLVDGFDAMTWIRENPVVKLLRIVIVSSSSLPKDQARASALGAVDYLEKYPTAQTLARVVAECSACNGAAE